MKISKTNIQKVTTRGQITLPKAWRDVNGSSLVQVQVKDDTLVIRPAKLDSEDEVVWSAARDNNGKGIEDRKFLKVLQEIVENK